MLPTRKTPAVLNYLVREASMPEAAATGVRALHRQLGRAYEWTGQTDRALGIVRNTRPWPKPPAGL